MLTPLEIENKKFSKQMMNGYNVEEIDDFLDLITIDYEKLYKEVQDLKAKINEMEDSVSHYKTIEGTLQNTLVMAQSTADEIRKIATQQAEQIIRDAELSAKEAIATIKTERIEETKRFEELKKQFDVYKAKMEALLISQLELLKDNAPDYELPSYDDITINKPEFNMPDFNTQSFGDNNAIPNSEQTNTQSYEDMNQKQEDTFENSPRFTEGKRFDDELFNAAFPKKD